VTGLSTADVETLGTAGFVVGHGFLGPALASKAHAAALEQVAEGTLHRAGIRRGSDHTLNDDIRGDSITWLDETCDGVMKEVWLRFDALRLQLNELAYLGLRRTELQLAHYPSSGAGYQRHLDSFPGADNRRMTAIVYLNPGWQPEHGGRLKLFVEPEQQLDPTLDTFVVFRSELIEHEVLPSYADRLAVTAWYSAR